MIAPLTRFELLPKTCLNKNILSLKVSLNGQQRMLERFNDQFLDAKVGLQLVQDPREVRRLDSFLDNMFRLKH